MNDRLLEILRIMAATNCKLVEIDKGYGPSMSTSPTDIDISFNRQELIWLFQNGYIEPVPPHDNPDRDYYGINTAGRAIVETNK